MPEFDDKINELQSRLENLLKYQEYFQSEISQIRYEINVLRAAYLKQNPAATPPIQEKPPVREYIPPRRNADPQPQQQTTQDTQTNHTIFEKAGNYQKSSVYDSVKSSAPKEKSDLEKFIGENLISKIGIVILILGVAIGAKYAIDNELISPLTRIILGYAFGFGLLGFAVKLKEKYLNFSAVLMSGAMAIMYFITFSPTAFTDFFRSLRLLC